MDDEMLTDQQRLVTLLENEGWHVTDVELSAYESPWAEEDDPEATVTLTARKPYEQSSEDGDDENPFRVQ